MPETVVPFLPRPANFRRICAWCRTDLGPLAPPIDHDSYAICEPCQHRYFDYLYEGDGTHHGIAEVLQERAVGE